MALKLFRSTGYSSILMAGEARLAMHPGWMILAVSLWTGFVSNVALWRAIAGSEGSQGMVHALVLGTCIAGASAAALSLLGWRKTIKLAAIALLFLVALTASSIWSQALPLDASLFDRPPASVIVPTWPSLLRWQVSAALAVLALVPGIWVWQKQVRRLSGPHQLKVNVNGMLLGALVAASSAWLLSRGL
jgi:glucan phosphoethanolaminetransferase (alkaline phosphatase superfamily)